MSTPEALHIRIAANFTAEPMEEFLAYWMSELSIRADIRFAPYNQVFQQLLEGGLLRANRGGINLVALDLDAWLKEGSIDEAGAELEKTLEDLIAALQTAGAMGAGGAVLLFPPASDQEAERQSELARARETVMSGCASMQGWTAIDLCEAASRYSVVDSRDPFTDELGNIPFTEEMYAAAATAAARWIRTACRKAPKVIVLDCDNTLWQGICGEGAVQITEPFRRLHEFMLLQQEKGALLALASKNNEPDVMAVLEADGSILRPEHFTAWKINWQPKSENLRAISEELGLGLNSFVFLDDSSYECLEVRNQCPEVTAIPLPPAPEEIPGFLEHLWVLDRAEATEEDRNRAKLYEAERQRAELSRRAMTQDEFLESLQLEIKIAPAAAADLPRVAQLTQRTTQFNMTGVLQSEQSLAALLSAGGHECWTLRVRDRFGDYGLVGVLLFETGSDSLRVLNFLLSCRALGRRVENRMVEHLRNRAAENGVSRIIIPVTPTARNRPALEFLHGLCGAPSNAAEPFECELSVTADSGDWRPAPAAEETPAMDPAAPVRSATTGEADVLVRIASDLRSAAAVVAAARTTMKRRPAAAAPLVAPRNPIECALERIWSECLAIEPLGVKDNFFDFGGHSLLATRILSRARAEFGVEISLAKFFEAPTIEGMAAFIGAALSPEASAVTAN